MTSTGAVPVQTFCEMLRPYRSTAIAEAAKVDIGTVSRWRTGKAKPGVDNLPALAAFLGIDVARLVDAIAAQKKAAA